MNVSFRHATPARAGLVMISILAAGAPGLSAQQLAPGRFESAAPPGPVLTTPRGATPASPVALRTPRASLARVGAGTAMGAVLGGALGAVAGAALGSLEGESDGFISATAALGAVGFAVGYPVGAAIGARRAATVDGARPNLLGLVLISSASAAAGGVVWNRIGEGFESSESMSSWYMGAAAGVATHWLLTSLAAQRLPAVPPPVPAPGDPDA